MRIGFEGIERGANVLVTGGAGFIGGRLVEVLKRECGARVRVLVRNWRNAARVARFDVDLLAGDLGDYDSLAKATAGCDVVFNLAFDFGAKNDQKRAVAVAGAENLARAAAAGKVRRLVHFGTISSYGDSKPGRLDERSPPAPTDDVYGLAKRDADAVLLRWQRQDGLPVAIVEPTIVYGPFSAPWTIGPLKQLATGVVVLPDEGGGICNAVYVDDVVKAALLAATNPRAVGEKFLISADKPVTWAEFYSAYEQMLGRESFICLSDAAIATLRKNPRDFSALASARRTGQASRRDAGVSVAARLVSSVEAGDAVLHFPSESRLALLKARTSVAIDKARALLDYSPRYDLKEGMEMTAQYARWAGLLKPAPARAGTVPRRAEQTHSLEEAQEAVSAQRLRSDREKLRALKNAHQHRRCFVIGNGPSLTHADVRRLKDEITIGCNALFLLFEETGFKPTFYTVEDTLVAEDRAAVIHRMTGVTKVFPSDLRYCLVPDNDTLFVNFVRPGYAGFPKFSDAFEDRAYWGGTVTFFNLQLAYHLGCEEIYLIGVDHSYRDKNEQDEQEKLTIMARTADANHFHPDYFGPGFRYHVPDVERMEVGYRAAKRFLDAQNVSVYNATRGGRLEVFPRVDFDSLFPLHEATAARGFR